MFISKSLFYNRLARNRYLNSVASFSNGVPVPLEYPCRSGQEFNIPVPWGHIAAKEWGGNGGRPVLALHGMGDNLASFERLAPLLPRYWHVVAVDFPGFGFSPPLPGGAQPSILTMVADCRRVVRHLGWNKCDIIGHSFGGGISLLYAALFPEDVGRVVGLDPVKFLCSPAFLVRQLLAEKIDDQLEQETPKTRDSFLLRPLDVAVKNLVEKWGNSLTKESAALLIRRARKLVTKADLDAASKLESKDQFISDNKIIFNASDRVPEIADHEEPQFFVVGNTDWHKAVTVPEFTVEQGQALAQAISKSIDILVIQSNWKIPKWYTNMESLPFGDFLNVLGKHGRLRRVFVDGTHHVHMNEPNLVLSHVVDFLNEANIDYRSIKPMEI